MSGNETLHETRFLSYQHRINLAKERERGWEMVPRRNTAGIVACLPVTARGEPVLVSQYRSLGAG